MPAAELIDSTGGAIIGSNDNDTLLGGQFGDTISGLGGDDFLDGGSGNDTIDAGAGNDWLYGRTESDLLLGGPGNDTILGGPGIDFFEGGDGYDAIVFFGFGDTYPTRSVIASLASGLIADDGYGNAEVMIGGSANQIERLVGVGGADHLTGKRIAGRGSQGETLICFLSGGRGKDTIEGVAGEERWIATDYLEDLSFDYSYQAVAVFVDLSAQTGGPIKYSVFDHVDKLINIGSARGGRMDDTLLGNEVEKALGHQHYGTLQVLHSVTGKGNAKPMVTNFNLPRRA